MFNSRPKFHIGQLVKAVLPGLCGDTYEVKGKVEECRLADPECPPALYLKPEPFRYRISGDDGLYRESTLEALG